MKIFYRTTALIIMSFFLLCSCATGRNGEYQWSSPQACIAAHTAGGAIVGAATGVLVAALSGNKKNLGKGAAIGGATGGAMAFAYSWGQCFAAFTKVRSESTRTYRDVQKDIGYTSRQGEVVKIKEYYIDPAAIAPGDKPTLSASYYVMTPAVQDITVTETLTLKIFDTQKNQFVEVGNSSETIVVKPGQRKAVSEIPIPSNAEEGNFFFVFSVNMNGKTDQKEMPLTITMNQEILAKALVESKRRHPQQKNTVAAAKHVSTSEQVADNGSKNISNDNSKQVKITANTANLRENPDASSKLVNKANKGEKFILLTTVTVSGKKWCQVKLENGTSAWILASLCKVME